LENDLEISYAIRHTSLYLPEIPNKRNKNLFPPEDMFKNVDHIHLKIGNYINVTQQKFGYTNSSIFLEYYSSIVKASSLYILI
jgi:hypothetical protein